MKAVGGEGWNKGNGEVNDATGREMKSKSGSCMESVGDEVEGWVSSFGCIEGVMDRYTSIDNSRKRLDNDYVGEWIDKNVINEKEDASKKVKK